MPCKVFWDGLCFNQSPGMKVSDTQTISVGSACAIPGLTPIRPFPFQAVCDNKNIRRSLLQGPCDSTHKYTHPRTHAHTCIRAHTVQHTQHSRALSSGSSGIHFPSPLNPGFATRVFLPQRLAVVQLNGFHSTANKFTTRDPKALRREGKRICTEPFTEEPLGTPRKCSALAMNILTLNHPLQIHFN